MGLYIDEINNKDITDNRIVAKTKSNLDILTETKRRLSDGSYRTSEEINYTYLGKKEGIVIPLGDGTTFTDTKYTEMPSVILDGTTYKMWYTGYTRQGVRIFYAESVDGISWTKQGMVMDIGDTGTVDSNLLYAPTVIKDGTTYKMWYIGHDGSMKRILYAESTDGISWTKDITAITGLNISGEEHYKYDELLKTVIKDGTTYKMWYVSYSSLMYATSSDGKVWTNNGIVLRSVNSNKDNIYDKVSILAPTVIKDGSTYRMLYSAGNGYNYRIMYATSTDGINWIRHGVVIDKGVNIEPDVKNVSYPSFIKDSDGYKVWYSGMSSKVVWTIQYIKLYNLDVLEENDLYNMLPISEDNTKNILLYNGEKNTINNVETLVGESNGGYLLSLGWKNVKLALKSNGRTIYLTKSYTNIQKVFITDSLNNIVEATFTANFTENTVTITDTFTSLGYATNDEMIANISIMVFYKTKTSIDKVLHRFKGIAKDDYVTVAGGPQYRYLVESLLNKPQTNRNQNACMDMVIKTDNRIDNYFYPTVTHDDISTLTLNYYNRTMLKFTSYLINDPNNNKAYLNLMFKDIMYNDGGNNIHDGIDVGMIFGNTGDTLYDYGVIEDLGPGSAPDSDGVGPMTLLFDDTSYKIWYSGYYLPDWRILYTESTDGLNWSYITASGDRWVSIDTERNAADTDTLKPYTPSVILDNGTYKMWYGGHVDAQWNIYYATSTDGITWTKHGIVLPCGASGTFDSLYAMNPSVILDNGTYKMWYTAQSNQDNIYNLAYATSTDGITWTKHGIVLTPGNDLDITTTMLNFPHVILDGSTYRMWYTGKEVNDYNFYGLYAESTDGMNWTRHGVVLNPGANGVTDEWGIYKMFVIKDGLNYKMWYAGNGSGGLRMHYAATEHIDVAVPTGWIDDTSIYAYAENMYSINGIGELNILGNISIPTPYLIN